MDPLNRGTLPPGRYLSLTIDVHPDYGGQTRALLMRTRILAAHGANADVLMVMASPKLDEIRSVLRERGLLSDDIDLINIYEYYRDTDWPGEEPHDHRIADLDEYLHRNEFLPDGTPWRRVYRLPGRRTLYDYQRPDGTTFLRIPRFIYSDHNTLPTSIDKVARDGRVVGTYSSIGGWIRRWMRDMSGGEQTFVFQDSRFLAPLVAPMKVPHIHFVYLMHNIHVGGERRWDSPSGPVYDKVIEAVDHFDAFVNLTDRQSHDIAMRRGRTSNMFVVPNPVDLPPEPPVIERDPRLVSVVARLEGQKRISHAVKAFAHVVAELPDARMDIYGRGSRTDGLQRVIDRLGLGSSVKMKGHDPRARDALWRSSAFMMTSLFEGYPLSTLESFSHGCPVVSYDIKYGPREQITEGEDGFLVESGDIRAMADRVIELLKDPDLVNRMSKAARAKATHHGYDRFLADWGAVLDATVEHKPKRTKLARADLDVRRLTVGRAAVGPGRFTAGKRLHFEADLKLTGRGDRSEAKVTLAAVHEDSGVVVDLPMSVAHEGGVFRLATSVPLSDLYPRGASEQDRCRLRVLLTWRNSSWQTFVTRPRDAPSGFEVDYGPHDEWLLTRR